MCGIMTRAMGDEDTPSIAIFDDTGNSGAVRVGAALSAEIAAAFGPRDETPFSVVATGRDGAVIGGLTGASHWRWCYIRQLWVEADWRRRGLGFRLLAGTERVARARQCFGVYVDTFDPGAARFYEKAGFTVIGRIDDFPPGHARRFLMKRLDGAE
jgi:GNAT superfamily N-acetyltransferase